MNVEYVNMPSQMEAAWDGKSNTVYLNRNNPNMTKNSFMTQKMTHELTHAIEQNENYKSIRQTLLDTQYDTNEELQQALQNKMQQYEHAGVLLTEDDAMAELTAEALRVNLMDYASVYTLLNNDVKFGNRIMQAIKDILWQIRKMFGGKNSEAYKNYQATRELEQMYRNVYDAVRNIDKAANTAAYEARMAASVNEEIKSQNNTEAKENTQNVVQNEINFQLDTNLEQTQQNTEKQSEHKTDRSPITNENSRFIIPYDESDINRIHRKNGKHTNLIAYKDITPAEFYEKWSKNKNKENITEKLYLGKVTDEAKNIISKVLGHPINGIDFIITNRDIRHIEKHHGETYEETGKGNIRITKEIINRLQEILNDFDYIRNATKINSKNESFEIAKDIGNGYLFYLQCINTGQKTIQGTTLYIAKDSTGAKKLSRDTFFRTSETTPTESLDNNIDQTNNKNNPQKSKYQNSIAEPQTLSDYLSKENKQNRRELKQFSLEEPIEETKNLIAVHNISGTNLLRTIENDGFISPSIAIRKYDTDHGYGDNTVLFNKNTIDPALDERNKVFGTDYLTATYPREIYKDTNEQAKNNLKQYTQDMENKYLYTNPEGVKSLNEIIDIALANPGASIEDFALIDNDLYGLYLYDSGKSTLNDIQFMPLNEETAEETGYKKWINSIENYVKENTASKLRGHYTGIETENKTPENILRQYRTEDRKTK